MVKTAIILAGGDSRRMGFDKQEIMLGGKSLMLNNLEKMRMIFDKIIISTNRPSALYQKNNDVVIVKDDMIGVGPLAGLKSALEACEDPFAYVIGCDVIFDVEVAEYFMTRLTACLQSGQKVKLVMAEKSEDFYEPFNGIYSKDLLSDLRIYLQNDGKRVQDFIRGVASKSVISAQSVKEDQLTKIYMNFNTRDQIREYENDI